MSTYRLCCLYATEGAASVVAPSVAFFYRCADVSFAFCYVWRSKMESVNS